MATDKMKETLQGAVTQEPLSFSVQLSILLLISSRNTHLAEDGFIIPPSFILSLMLKGFPFGKNLKSLNIFC